MDGDEGERPEELAPLPPRTLSALPKKSRRSAGSISARSQDSGHMSGRGDSDDELAPQNGKCLHAGNIDTNKYTRPAATVSRMVQEQ